MLKEKYDEAAIRDLICDYRDFHPFPKGDERQLVEGLPDCLQKRWIEAGKRYLDFSWPPLPAVRFMDFKRNGNRSEFEKLHFKRRNVLATLVLAEYMEGKGRFLDQIINGIWAICEETFWGVPAHNYVSGYPDAPLPDVNEPIIDLFAGETAGLLCWTYYLLKSQLDKVTPLICRRIETEVKRRILDPYMERDDFWWMGLLSIRPVNNWNPWCNSNCLTAFLIIEKDRDRRVKAVRKALESLDAFMAVYHDDGGCDEGTSYWGRAGASLFDCLELLFWASGGRINFYNEPLVQQIGRYIYRAHIHDEYFINFADGGARVAIAASLVYRYGQRIGDQRLVDMGISAYHLQAEKRKQYAGEIVPASLLRQLPEIFIYEKLQNKKARPPYVRDVWLDGLQVMAAREREGDYKGFYLAAKGGHNSENHNHNDVGQFIVYYSGLPVIIDVGVETYTAKTFSSARYEIWTMQSNYHNLPTVNGFGQQPGIEYRARNVVYKKEDNTAELSLDISCAYPPEAGIKKWIRRCTLHRGDLAFVEINDDFELNSMSDDIMVSLMVPCENSIDNEKGIVYLRPGDVELSVCFDSSIYACEGEYISITDERLSHVWGSHIYRLVFRAKRVMDKGSWNIKVKANTAD
ncbi:MAG: heparinase [Clostridiales bacterium]|jgi:hypothetical protein|nr:heparinase [Clostridiales bacterium]